MLTDAEFASLLAEVEQDYKVLAKSQDASEEAMKKDDEHQDEPEMDAAADDAAAHSEEAPAEEQFAPEAPAEEAPMEDSPDEGQMEQDPAAEEMEQAPEDQIDEGQDEGPALEDLYGSMDELELEAHYEAIKNAMHKCWMKEAIEKGEINGKDIGESEEKANGDDPKKASMAKEEHKAEDKADCKEEEKKEDMKKSLAESQAHIVALESALDSFAKAALKSRLPMRKSITEMPSSVVIETPKLSAEELRGKAKELVKNPSLTKSERSSLNSFFYNGAKSDVVQELVKTKSNKA